MRLGLAPVAAAPALAGSTDRTGTLAALAAGTAPAEGRPRPAAPWPVPLWPYAWAWERLAAGLVLGICPILLQRSPDVPLEAWLDCLDPAGTGPPARDRLRAALATAGLDEAATTAATA
jgi:hypothetical protein